MWADKIIEALRSGKTVQFRPTGRSMEPTIISGTLVTVTPPKIEPQVGQIVLCMVKGAQYLHLVKAVENAGAPSARFLIGNNKGRVNGWISRDKIFGLAIKIEGN